MKYFKIGPLLIFIFILMSCSDRDKQSLNPKQVPSITQPLVKNQKRFCLTLDLKNNPKLIEEYKYWHDSKNIWPEIPKGIRDVGITDMEIYLLGTRLFMIMETEEQFEFDKQMAKLAELPRQKEWETFVAKFQKALPGAKSNEKWKIMEKIFKLP